MHAFERAAAVLLASATPVTFLSVDMEIGRMRISPEQLAAAVRRVLQRQPSQSGEVVVSTPSSSASRGPKGSSLPSSLRR
jgi:hypothetical protein